MSQLCPKALIALALRCATIWASHLPSTIFHIHILLNGQPLTYKIGERINCSRNSKLGFFLHLIHSYTFICTQRTRAHLKFLLIGTNFAEPMILHTPVKLPKQIWIEYFVPLPSCPRFLHIYIETHTHTLRYSVRQSSSIKSTGKKQQSGKGQFFVIIFKHLHTTNTIF